MAHYRGSKPCPCCGKPGSENARPSVKEICWNCKKVYQIGLAHKAAEKNEEETSKYAWFFQHYHAWPRITRDSKTSELGSFWHSLLGGISISNYTGLDYERVEALRHTSGDNGVMYCIPMKFYIPLKKMEGVLYKHCAFIKSELDSLPDKAKAAIQEEKNRIYSLGVQRGKNMLLQLNKNEISLKDFDQEKFIYKEYEAEE